MKFILLILPLYYTLLNGDKNTDKKLPAYDENHIVNLQRKYADELHCLKRVDAILKSKWSKDLGKIPTNDLGFVKPNSERKEPSKLMYYTVEQEWLIESGSPAKEIDSCMRALIPDIVPLMNRVDIDCLNSVFAHHIEEEYVHDDVFKKWLKLQSKEQLPFRRFVSFSDFVNLLFQSRTPDALSDVERSVHESAEYYLTTEDEKVDKTYIMEQECEWKNARELRRASNNDARLKEFVRQVKDSVNQQLGNTVVKRWNLNATLPRDKYLAWLAARDKMTVKINAEVERLKNQRKDVQWLCEHATKLAYKLSDEQADILIANADETGFDLQILDVADKARGIENAMERIKDFRLPVLKILADKFEEDTKCFSAFLHLVQNHRRFDVALAFVDEDYNYPEFYCKEKNLNLGLIATRFCKCIGSFCVHHGLAALFAEEYLLTQGPDGTYRVVPSGVISRDKVQAWDNRD